MFKSTLVAMNVISPGYEGIAYLWLFILLIIPFIGNCLHPSQKINPKLFLLVALWAMVFLIESSYFLIRQELGDFELRRMSVRFVTIFLVFGLVLFWSRILETHTVGKLISAILFWNSVLVCCLLLSAFGILDLGGESVVGRSYAGFEFPVRKTSGFDQADAEVNLCLTAALLALVINRETYSRLFAVLVGLWFLTGIVLLQSRSGILGVSVALLVCFVPRIALIPVASMLVAILVVNLSLFVGDSQILQANFLGRFLGAQTGLDAFIASDGLGGGSQGAMFTNVEREFQHYDLIHNTFIESIAIFGIFGFLLCAILIFPSFLVLTSRFQNDRILKWLVCSYICGIVEMMLFRMLLVEFLFMLWVGVFVVWASGKRYSYGYRSSTV